MKFLNGDNLDAICEPWVDDNLQKGGPFSAFERDRTSEHTVKGHICDLNLDIFALVSQVQAKYRPRKTLLIKG